VTDGSKAKKTGQIHDGVGIREIKMPVPLLAIVRAATVPSRHEKDDPWVFTTVTGLPLQPGVRIRRRWAAIVKRTGLPTGKGAPTFYTLKHAGNSYALSTGVSGDVQAYKMGQTTSRMANRNYRTILTPEKQRQADVFDAHVPSNAPDSSA
jgi:hypothetical protein